MRLSIRTLSLALGLCAAFPSVAAASAPAGVWGLVEKVTVDPAVPDQARIDGVFMVAGEKPDFAMYTGYSVPAHGFMYYECPKGQDKLCTIEWEDLTSASLSGNNCRGWGDNQLPDNGSVRATGSPQDEPDAWPLGMGVVQGFTPCDALHAWVKENPLEAGTTGDPGGTAGEPASTGSGGEGGTLSPETGAPATSTVGEGTAGSAGETAAVTTGAEVTTGATGSSATDSAGTTDGQDDKGGCGCSAGGSGGGAAALGLLLLGLRRRRR